MLVSVPAMRRMRPKILSKLSRLEPGSIDIIEDLGVGGARCMLAEIFLQKKPRSV
jgi:hypothetical protein